MVQAFSGASIYPARARERAANRRRIRMAQADRSALAWNEHVWDRNETAEEYQGMIGRIVTLALKRGVPRHITRRDLEQRLNIELLVSLDRKHPGPGVALNAYLWKTLNRRIADAINAENNTSGLTEVPTEHRTAERAFQLFEAHACDVGRNGRRATTPDPDSEDGEYAYAKVVRVGWKQEYRPTGKLNDAGIPIGKGNHTGKGMGRGRAHMVSWAELRNREVRRALKLDVRAALASFDRPERKALALWDRGFSQDDIAARLGISQPSTSRMLNRALKVLRGRLSEYRDLSL